MIILSIETSCDETAAAIVKFSKNKAEVLANVVSSQIKTHSKFGGVVPSLASRMHLKNMVPVLRKVFKLAEKKVFSEGDIRECRLQKKFKIDYVAVTNGPGLIPALMIGTQAAKTLAYALNKPLIPIHHIEGHIYANWLRPISVSSKSQIPNPKQITNPKLQITNYNISAGRYPKSQTNPKLPITNYQLQNYKLWTPEFPVLCLIVSGGHTQLVLMKKDLDYKIIGETVDDAAGEAFDKVAKLLEVGYPGGPMIEKMARLGDRNKFKFPRPMMNSKDFNFSFSGLKTAVLYEIRSNVTLSLSKGDMVRQAHHDIAYKQNIAASFQQAVIDVLISKTIRAAKEYKVKNIILGGGVSANKELQKQFRRKISPAPHSAIAQGKLFAKGGVMLSQLPIPNYQLPITNLSTDNALMIAVAGYYHILNNKNISSWKNVEADANLVLSI